MDSNFVLSLPIVVIDKFCGLISLCTSTVTVSLGWSNIESVSIFVVFVRVGSNDVIHVRHYFSMTGIDSSCGQRIVLKMLEKH